ncbi:MAG: TIGR02996 domain-containing protein [Gemmata sp.]
MSDREALIAAICAQPDEDTPRLVYADYMEENGEGAYAAFVRAQVELAAAPPWEPLAVRACRRAPDLVTGARFRHALPPLSGATEWGAHPFRRGFGWWLSVRAPAEWGRHVVPVLGRAPVGRVTFWGALLDDWRAVAGSGALRGLRALAFATSPIEPLFALRDADGVEGVSELHFARASGAGMPEVLEDLFASRLGRAVRGLHFHVGYESLAPLLDALNTGGPLERLSFSVMGITGEHLRRLFDGPTASALTELHLRDEPLGADGLRVLAEAVPPTVRDLTLTKIGVRADGLEALARSPRLTSVRRLDLSGNPLTPRAAKVLSLSHPLAGLRSLNLSGCHLGDKGVRHVARSRWWANLVEADLSNNPISRAGVQHLLSAPVPPDLTALVLDDAVGAESRAALARKFGPAVVFVAPGPPG